MSKYASRSELERMSIPERAAYVRERGELAVAALPEAERLMLKATPLPWFHDGADITDVGLVDEPEDAALIVYAVNHLPAYEAAVEALERLLDWREFYMDPTWRESHDLPKSTPWDDAREALRRLREDPA